MHWQPFDVAQAQNKVSLAAHIVLCPSLCILSPHCLFLLV